MHLFIALPVLTTTNNLPSGYSVQTKSKTILVSLAFTLIVGLFLDQADVGAAARSQKTMIQNDPSLVRVQLHPDQQLTFYYFHNQRRCKSCLGVEAAITEFLKHSFSKELTSGQIQLTLLNSDLKENQHLVNQFNITFSTLVVAFDTKNKQRQWQRFDDVWSTYSNSNTFNDYMHKNLHQLTGSEL